MTGVMRRQESAVLVWGFARLAPTQAALVGLKADCSGSQAEGLAQICQWHLCVSFSWCCRAAHGLSDLLSSAHVECCVFGSVSTVLIYI